MLTAHLPAGYCLARLVQGQRRTGALLRSTVFACSVLPDLDLLWFYLVDDRAIHHHRYWVHVPFFWACVAAVLLPLAWRTAFRQAAVLGLSAIFLHLLLDTIAGGIMWLYPLDATLFQFAVVPPAYDHFMISFLLHWTFLMEIVVWLAAAGLLLFAPRPEAAGG